MNIDLPEVTTAAALEEKKKLQKGLNYVDMIFFTAAALIGLDTLGAFSANGEQALTWLLFSAVTFLMPYGLLTAELGSEYYVWYYGNNCSHSCNLRYLIRLWQYYYPLLIGPGLHTFDKHTSISAHLSSFFDSTLPLPQRAARLSRPRRHARCLARNAITIRLRGSCKLLYPHSECFVCK